HACGIPSDSSVSLPIDLTNLGPGVATNVWLMVQSHTIPVSWAVPDGLVHEIASPHHLYIHIGDMAIFEHLQVDLRVTPQREGELVLEASIVMDVRNLDPDKGRITTTIPVAPPVPANLDLSVNRVEVTQGIQDGNQSIDLIAGKATLIRVYSRTNFPLNGVGASMRISGTTNGTNWSRNHDEVVTPLRPCIALALGDGNRSDLNASFNFLVPQKMLDGIPQGPFLVEIHLDPENSLQEQDRSNNIHVMELDFTELPPICLQTHRVRHLAMGGGDTRGPHFFPSEQIERAESMLPTREILQFSTGNVLEKMGFFTWNPYELDPGGSQNTGRILSTLWTHQKTTRDPRECKRRGAITLHVGLVAENNLSTVDGKQFNGIAYRPGRSQVVRIRSDGSGFNSQMGGVVLAHEIGHNFNRRHVNCGNPDGPDSNYPYPSCQLSHIILEGEGIHSVYYGADLMDPTNPAIIAPRPSTADSQLSDLLSYADNTWTGDYTWNAMRTYMIDNQKDLQEVPHPAINWMPGVGNVHAHWLEAARKDEGKIILLTAVITEIGDVNLEMILPVSEGVVPGEKALDLVAKNFSAAGKTGVYTIELLDDLGNILETIPAAPDEIEDAETPESTLGVLLPMPGALQAIRIRNDAGDTVAGAERSPSAPQVTLNSPSAGDVVDDVLIVDWDATDADGDNLVAMIQYSDDAGESWITLTIDAPYSPQVFDAELIPGAPGTARIRLIVSDGFNATEATSDLFTVLPRAPLVTITRPQGGQAFAANEPIFLTGNAYDPEDGPILEQGLIWEVDGIGEVGFGRSLILGDLSPGTHRITLTATDNDGDTTTDEVTITIGSPRATRGQVIGVVLGVLQTMGETLFDLNEDEVIDSGDIIRAE
ncbi:MAG: hypothetical protein JJU11_11495, partial [Candidatus Sumerlaeia bacterium]|nr:hypothetical protein [Candidatus Sumerlaeia bacterium]